MTTELTQTVIVIGGLNLLIGVAYTIAVYKALERVPALAAIIGFLLATAVVAAEAHLGEQMLSVTVAEMKILVIASVLSAALGITSITAVFKPSTTTRS